MLSHVPVVQLFLQSLSAHTCLRLLQGIPQKDPADSVMAGVARAVVDEGRFWGGQAIFQCLQGLPEGGMRRIILTASGGAFRDWPVEKLVEVTPALAVTHPNWRFGLPSRP